MQPTTETDYKKLLTDVIKKQMIILGPSITLVKARNVKGLVVADDGTVTGIQGKPQETIQSLIDQFVQLSGMIVKKTMEPLLSLYPDAAALETPIVTPPTPPVSQLVEQPVEPAKTG